jgi:ketosteroid isomerase-like protein
VSSEQEKNKALVRRYFEEVWVKGNLAAVDEFMAPDYVEHPVPPGSPSGGATSSSSASPCSTMPFLT